MDNKILERLSEIISSFAEARDIVENASDEIGEILKELDRDGSIYDVIESYSRVYSLPDMWSEDADALDAIENVIFELEDIKESVQKCISRDRKSVV